MDIITVSAVITAGATAIYMLFTGWLIWETRKARESQERPQVDIYIQRARDWGNKIEFFIENNGFTGAHEIKLFCSQEFQCFSSNGNQKHNKIQNWGPFVNGIPFLPPRGKRNYTLTFMTDDFENKIKTELIIKAEYKDNKGKKYSLEFPIRFSEFENTLLPIEDPSFKIAKHLESIQKNIEKITSGWSKLRVIHQSKEQHQEELKQHREELEQHQKGLKPQES